MKQLAQALSDTFGVTTGYVDAEGKKKVTTTGTNTTPDPGPTKYNIEVTDTLGHEPNYAWVRRYELTVPDGTSRGAVVRRAKRLIGWSGVRCTRVDYGDMTELRPVGECMVCFIT